MSCKILFGAVTVAALLLPPLGAQSQQLCDDGSPVVVL